MNSILRSYNPGGINPSGLGCSVFVRHYSRNHIRFLFLCVLRCFTSAGSLCIPMNSVCNGWLLYQSGFPIRKSPDQSALTAPRSLSQLCHVLHRLLSPRHPPRAYKTIVLSIKNIVANLLTSNRLIIRRLFHPQSS